MAQLRLRQLADLSRGFVGFATDVTVTSGVL